MSGKHAPAEERFWRHVRKSDGCWEWISATDPNGYGVFSPGGKTAKAHSWSYRHFVGEVPAGMQLDHLCHTRDTSCTAGRDCPHRRCVNPEHLEPVLPVENVRRGRSSGKTHCPRGHAYEGANLRLDKTGRRRCKTCTGRLVLALAPDRLTDKHGTTSGYSYGCRCPECRSANSEYGREYRAGVRRRLMPDATRKSA